MAKKTVSKKTTSKTTKKVSNGSDSRLSLKDRKAIINTLTGIRNRILTDITISEKTRENTLDEYYALIGNA